MKKSTKVAYSVIRYLPPYLGCQHWDSEGHKVCSPDPLGHFSIQIEAAKQGIHNSE